MAEERMREYGCALVCLCIAVLLVVVMILYSALIR